MTQFGQYQALPKTKAVLNGAEKCDRCGGTGIFITHVLNGNPIPAHPDAGTCYRCLGTGVEPVIHRNNNMKGVTTLEISKESQIQVFQAMFELIQAKGAPNKLVSTWDLQPKLAEMGIETTKRNIEGVLDVLIRHKLVRYWTNEKNYIYYGITSEGYKRWAEKKVNDDKQFIETLYPTTNQPVESNVEQQVEQHVEPEVPQTELKVEVVTAPKKRSSTSKSQTTTAS